LYLDASAHEEDVDASNDIMGEYKANMLKSMTTLLLAPGFAKHEKMMITSEQTVLT